MLMNLRRTVADGSCDSEWRRYSIVGGAFECMWLYSNRRSACVPRLGWIGAGPELDEGEDGSVARAKKNASGMKYDDQVGVRWDR